MSKLFSNQYYQQSFHNIVPHIWNKLSNLLQISNKFYLEKRSNFKCFLTMVVMRNSFPTGVLMCKVTWQCTYLKIAASTKLKRHWLSCVIRLDASSPYELWMSIDCLSCSDCLTVLEWSATVWIPAVAQGSPNWCVRHPII